MGNETEREAFEQLVRETCHTDEYTFKLNGGAYFRTTYAKTYDGLPPREMASVQTLWNFYQAGAAYQRSIDKILVGAIEEITSMTFDEWTNGAIACRIALEALTAYKAAQERK